VQIQHGDSHRSCSCVHQHPPTSSFLFVFVLNSHHISNAGPYYQKSLESMFILWLMTGMFPLSHTYTLNMHLTIFERCARSFFLISYTSIRYKMNIWWGGHRMPYPFCIPQRTNPYTRYGSGYTLACRDTPIGSLIYFFIDMCKNDDKKSACRVWRWLCNSVMVFSIHGYKILTEICLSVHTMTAPPVNTLSRLSFEL